jgi:hypothetical protein
MGAMLLYMPRGANGKNPDRHSSRPFMVGQLVKTDLLREVWVAEK